MTLAELAALPRDFLTPDEVAECIGCNPQTVRGSAETAEGRSGLGFPVCRLGTRTYIPRLAFLAWATGGVVDTYIDTV